MAHGQIRKAIEKSIRYGKANGRIDEARDAATLGMLRYMADFLDNSDGETPGLRYVSPASFLTYCEKLGFVPDFGNEKETPKANVIRLVGNSQWKKTG